MPTRWWHQPVIIKKSAKQAGVSEVAPYKHFKDKQCLIAAIAEQGFLQLAERLKKAEEEFSQGAKRLFF